MFAYFFNMHYAFGLNFGDILSNTSGMKFTGSGTSADPYVITGTTAALNKIKWLYFNLASNEYAKFVFGASNQTILNYVPTPGADANPAYASIINGTIQTVGNGRLILANPNGIYMNGANITGLSNMGEFCFSNFDISGYDTLLETSTTIPFVVNTMSDGNVTGINIRNTTINGFDNIIGFGNGIKVADNSNLTANEQLMFLTSGAIDYNISTSGITYHYNFFSPWQVYYFDTTKPYSNSYADILVDRTSSIKVANGKIELYDYAAQTNSYNSIEIQGSLEATSSTAGAGGIYLASDNLYTSSSALEYAKINITGTLKTSNNNPIQLVNDQIQSHDYNISYSNTPLSTDPTSTQSSGNITTDNISNLQVSDPGYYSPPMTFPHADVQAGTNKVTRTYTNPDTDTNMKAIFNYIYGPQPTQSPKVDSETSNIAAAIAVPTGTAAGVGAPSGFAAAPFLLAGLEPNSVIYAAAPIEGIKNPNNFLKSAITNQLGIQDYDKALETMKTNGKYYLMQKDPTIINGTFNLASLKLPTELQNAQKVRINITMASQPYKEIDGQPELSLGLYKNISKVDLSKKFQSQQFLHNYLMRKYEVPMKITSKNYANGLQKLSGELNLGNLQNRNQPMQIAVKYMKNGFHKSQSIANPKVLDYAYVVEFEKIR